ncbi:Ig-like domain-containing protein, partial [uncultured Alsobacter sp.]|uniref:beta strand repeat-containing protein n=1 Tax=uncultured Alsobacter sp. TaxID=1748258 RepID=UPI0025E2E6C9
QSGLVDGAYQFRAKVTDTAGNTTTSNVVSVTVDTAAPAAGTLSLTGFSDSGTSSTDFISTDNAFNLSLGGAESGAGITYQRSTDGGTTWLTTSAAQSTLVDGNYSYRALVTDTAGNTATSNEIAVKVDNAGATVSSVAIASATGIQNGRLNQGDVVSVAVTFNEAVVVTGTPVLALNVGGTSVNASYASGSGTSQLVFNYTILAGQTDANGISLGANALSLGTGTIRDLAGNNATLATAAVTDNANYVVDTTPATVSSVAIASATGIQNSTLNAGDVVTVRATFSEAVSVTGSPLLALNINGTTVNATYASGSGSTQLLFNYTIQAGQNDATGISIGANAIALNSGTITDLAGNTATITSTAVTDNASYLVDTTAPAVTAVAITGASGSQNTTLNAGDVVTVRATFGEAVTVTGTPQLALNIGGTTVLANYTSGTGTTQLNFTYTIQAGQTDANGISIDANALSLNSGTITDAAGNAATLTSSTVADNVTYRVDTTAPTVSGVAITSATGLQSSTLNAGDVVTVRATFSEAVTVTGTPQLALNIGGTTVLANYTSGTGTTQLNFTYTILAGQTDANGISIDANALTLNAGTITDAAGNAATLTTVAVADNAGYLVDTTAPAAGTLSLSNFSDSGSSSTDFISTDTAFDLSVSGAEAGATVVYQRSTDGTTWTTTTAAQSGLTDNTYQYRTQVTDAAGNTANSAILSVTVDNTAPTASGAGNLAIVSATGIQNSTLNAGDVVSVRATFSEAVLVTGTPQLALNIGGTTVQASYASGSGSTQLVFTYTILAGQTDTDGISIGSNALSLNGGTIRDAAGNNATLTTTSVGANAGYLVDTTAPTLPGNTTLSYNSNSDALSWTAATGATSYAWSASGTTSGGTAATASGTVTTNSADLTTQLNAQSLNGRAVTITVTALDNAGNSASYTSLSTTAPVGVSGSPTNLGLGNPADGALVTLTVASLPAGWTLDGWTRQADGTWSITTADPGSLTYTTPVDYVGAEVIEIAMNWTDANGVPVTRIVLDNAEAFAPGNPIFAWAGDDNLTGSAGADTFVMADPIGNNVVYAFDVARDRLDLLAFTGFTSFADVVANLAETAAGDALLTLADGQTVTFQGVSAAALTAANFVFDETPVTQNAGTIAVGSGAMLPLAGELHNTGTVALDAAGRETLLQILQRGLTLTGGGEVVLSDDAGNVIAGTAPGVTLTNVDNVISGAGQIGQGQLALVNHGTIVADGTQALVIDTGANAVVNTGTIEATGTGGLTIASNLVNDGMLRANGGDITVAGQSSGTGVAVVTGAATLDLEQASSLTVDLGQGDGILEIDDSQDFTGQIAAFGSGDQLRLTDIAFGSQTSLAFTADASGAGGTLTVTDGTHVASLALLGQYAAAGFSLGTDQEGGAIVTYASQGTATSDPLTLTKPVA